MNLLSRLLRACALLASLVLFCGSLQAAETRVFELRIYSTHPGRLDALLTRFREHTCALFEKHGMTNVGYWLPADEKDGAGNKLVYLLAYPSRDAANAAWAAFAADPEWKAVAKASESTGKIVAKVDSIFLTATDYSPEVTPSAAARPRVFELRTYTTPEGKLAALDARFRGGETALFAKAGMKGIGYFHPTDAAKGGGHTLIYLLAHANRDAAAASWASFRDDPAWKKMKADSEVDGSLTSKVESLFLVPTDFSAIK